MTAGQLTDADWRRAGDNLIRQLLVISRDVEPRLLRALRERGHPGLRPSFARFLYLIWDEPRPLAAIADELGLTRQAASLTARLIEEAGYAERRANPADGRSKLVAITPQGRAVDDERAREAIEKCAAHYEGLIGVDAVAALVRDLADLRESLGVPVQPGQATGVRASVGVLPLVALHARDELVRALAVRGYDHLTAAHLDLFVLLGPRGGRPSDLARLQGISRQAVGATLQELERLGYLSRGRERSDRRGVVFRPNERGRHLLLDHLAGVDTLEAGYRSLLGDRRFSVLVTIARELALALQLDTAAYGATGLDQAAPGDQPVDLDALARRLRDRLGPEDLLRLAALLSVPGPAH